MGQEKEFQGSLKGHFLIAMPSLADPNFSQTVTYICEHTPEGAVGLVINRVHPELTMEPVLKELNLESVPEVDSLPVHLESLAKGQGPESFIITLGCAAWGPGQLESEIIANAWLTCPASETVLFETPVDKRWEKAAKLMGIDVRLLTDATGHA